MKCEYCRNEDPKEINSERFSTTGLYKSGDRFKVFFKDYIYGKFEHAIKFDYCPKCGQKLEE